MKGLRLVLAVIVLLAFAVPAWSQTPFTGPLGGEEKLKKAEPAEKEGEEMKPTEGETLADPIEPWNRLVFQFNDKMYFWLIKPAATGYNAVVPEVARTGIRNAFRNAEMPVRFVNAVLQADFKAAGIELVRVIINSTVGIGGLFDVMKQNPDFQPQEKDLGQTLGKYGIGNGMYIVWPFLGPSTIRDTGGYVGDGFLTPIDYIRPEWKPVAITAGEYFNDTSLHIGDYEDLKEASIDPYLAVKDAYLQHRKYILGK